MHVVHITNDLQLNGTGHTNSTLDLALAQAAAGSTVTLVCLTSDDPTRALLARYGIRLLEGVGAKSPGTLLRSAATVRALVSSADVLHVHTVRAIAVSAVGGPLRAWLRSVATLHNPHQRSTVLLCSARRVVTLSAAQAAHVRRRTAGVRRPSVILNGTAGTQRLRPVDQLTPVPLESNTILFVGALHERKGVDVLLRAMPEVLRLVPSARLVVIGNRDAASFEELAVRLGISSSVDFVGFVADPRTYMLSASVFVLPSRQEGFGNVLTEARECGTPIIASRVGGIPEALSGGSAGMLVDPDDHVALAAAISSVLQDGKVAAALRAAGARGLDQMRPARAALDYDHVYRSLRTRSRRRMKDRLAAPSSGHSDTRPPTTTSPDCPQDAETRSTLSSTPLAGDTSGEDDTNSL